MGQCRSSFSVLVLGLGGSGKSTLLRGIEASSLHEDRGKNTSVTTPAPTFAHDHTTVRLPSGITLFFDEFPSNSQSRATWAEFFPKRDALVWVMDVSDSSTHEESIQLLGEVLNGKGEDKGISPQTLVIIFLNKLDIWLAGGNKDGRPLEKTLRRSIKALGAPHTFRYTWNCAKLTESCKNFALALADDIAEHKDPLLVRMSRRVLS